MALFDDAVPANSEAVKLGAKQIRDLKTALNTLLGTLFNDDGTPKDNTVTTTEITNLAVTAAKLAADSVTTAKLIDGVLTADATGRAKMADGFVTLAKLLDGLFTADAAGRAKFADGFINTAKLADSSVTEDKLADGSVSADKLAPSAGIASALARWSGAGYFVRTVTKVLPTVIPAKTRITVSALPTFPLTGSGVTLDNAPCGIIVYNVTGDDSTDSGSNIHLGRMYYIYAWDANTISLHTSPQGAIDGTTDIVTLSGNFVGASTYYFKALQPSTVFKRNCDIVPLISSSSFSLIHGYRVIWRTAWADALSGLAQLTQEFDSATNSNKMGLQPCLTTASKMEFCFVDASNDWVNGGNDISGAQANNHTGSNFVTAFN